MRKERSELAEQKIREWEEFVRTHRHIFEQIAKGLEKRKKKQ